jgi:hypothetical protein
MTISNLAHDFPGYEKLPEFNVDQSTITVSGLSAGGAFATQGK